MGNRDDIDEMSNGNAAVMTTVLKLIDKYDLYGQIAYPKHHKQSDVPEIYRFAAKTKVSGNFIHVIVGMRALFVIKMLIVQLRPQNFTISFMTLCSVQLP